MNYKLIILDIDGTLIQKFGDPISDVVVNTLLKAKEKGVKIVLCTGKSFENTQPYIKQLNIEDSYCIVESGAKIIGPGPEIKKVESIPVNEIKMLFEKVTPISESSMACTNGQWKNITEIIESDEVTTISFVCSKDKPNQESDVINKIKEVDPTGKFAFTIASHWEGPEAGSVVILTSKNATKFHGAEYIKDIYNISTENVIAIGDMPNDIPMMQAAGTKIAMGNARDELKLIADYICPSVQENGVADAIEKYILS